MKAIIFSLRDPLEHNKTLVYKSIFGGETAAIVQSLSDWSCELYDQDTSAFNENKTLQYCFRKS
jgi:hypothetical protein